MGIEQVLHAQRQAVQRAAQRTRVELPGVLERGVGCQVRECVNLRFALGDAIQAGAHQVLGADVASRQPAGQFDGVESFECGSGHGGLPTG